MQTLALVPTQIPFGPAGLYLLGRVCRLTHCMTEAKDCFARALQGNPLLWSAYEELCAVGASPRRDLQRTKNGCACGRHSYIRVVCGW
jgi:hypothetical protein